jgi:hypothetical protein
MVLNLGAGLVAQSASVLLIGLTAGGEFAVLAYLTARFFGLRRYAVIFGVLWGVLISLGGVWSAVIGAVVDRTGAYASALYGCAACLCIAAVLLCGLGRPTDEAMR